MQATEAAASPHAERLEGLRAKVDSVYFLMYEGWSDELESNRWHFARRWGRHLPVTLLQPCQREPRRQPAAPAAIDNCEVLSVLRPRGETTYPLLGLVQAAQVMEHMASRGHERPLLWCYNPWLAALYATVPAAVRVYHASENHFDFEGQPKLFYRELEAALRMSDLVIPVSSGVAEGIRSRVAEAKVSVVTNGCDITCYSPIGSASDQIAALRGGSTRVAVFAGNINARVDFDLVERAAVSNPPTLMIFAGPVGRLDERDTATWQRVLDMPNVHHLGRMTPGELAALYRSADLGFIPYRRESWIVRNGFPLKTLEMAGTGLPVVASHMQPIVGLATAIAVAEDDRGFLDSFASMSRAALTDDERVELLEVAAANDYDRKFEEVVERVAGSIPSDGAVHTRVDDLLLAAGYEPWQASCTRILDRFRPSPLAPFSFVYEKLAGMSPDVVHRFVPTWLKDRARGRRVE